MGVRNNGLLRDSTGKPIPQYFDKKSNTFKPVTEVREVSIANVDSENGLPVNLHNLSPSKAIVQKDLQSKVKEHTFHDAENRLVSGNVLDVGSYRELTVDIYGDFTYKHILFEASGSSGQFQPIMGVKLTDFTMTTFTTGSDKETWTFNITGQKKIRMKISAVTGTVSIKGIAVS